MVQESLNQIPLKYAKLDCDKKPSVMKYSKAYIGMSLI